MKNSLLLLLFLLAFSLSVRFTNLSQKHRLLKHFTRMRTRGRTNKYNNRIEPPSKDKFLEWPQDLDEKVLGNSGEPACDDTKTCRGWSE